MNVKPKPICFVCLREVESSKVCSSRVWEQGENETGSDFGLYIKFIQFATHYLKIPSTTFKKFLSITITKNGGKIFCENCRKTVQNICNSYLELIQVQLRLSWKLGELEKLMENAEYSGSESELVQELANNLGIDDASTVEKIRELLSVRCEHMSQQFQPQLVLSRYETLPASSSHSQSGQIIKKEVDHSSENSDNDWCPPDEDEIVSNASTSPLSCSQTKYHVILMNNQIKMEDVNNKLEVDAEQEEENQDSDSSSDISSAGEEDSKRRNKSGSRSLKKGAAQASFSCEVESCQNQFETYLELNSHLEEHTQEVLYCQVCGWGFIDPNLLKLHELVHVKRTKVAGKRGNQILCPASNCVSTFETVALLQDHYNIRHGVSLKRFSCSECPHASTSSSALRQHKRVHHLGKPQKGRQLPKKISTATKVSLVSCEVEGCPEEFKSHLELNSHLESHSKSINFCKDCGFGFIDVNLLKLHELTHLKSVRTDGMRHGKYYCPEAGCSFKIDSIAMLQDHYNSRHGLFLKRFKCEQCEHAATSSRALQTHVRFMHNESNLKRRKLKQKQWPVKPGPRQCGPCGLQFNNRSALIRHRRQLHLKKVCEICSEAFTGELSLKKHLILTHPDMLKKVEKVELKFPCLTCEKAFPTVAKLELHTKSSHGEKVHKCEFCHKMFRTKDLVTDHRIKYHDSKPCPHCEKAFTGGEALRLHILSNHMDKTFTELGRHACPHCPLRYNRQSYLHRHIWNCHPDAPENLECSTCDLKMEGGREKVMEQHELTHMTEEERKLQRKVHICHVCGQEFLKLVHFNKHVSAHEEIV